MMCVDGAETMIGMPALHLSVPRCGARWGKLKS